MTAVRFIFYVFQSAGEEAPISYNIIVYCCSSPSHLRLRHIHLNVFVCQYWIWTYYVVGTKFHSPHLYLCNILTSTTPLKTDHLRGRRVFFFSGSSCLAVSEKYLRVHRVRFGTIDLWTFVTRIIKPVPEIRKPSKDNKFQTTAAAVPCYNKYVYSAIVPGGRGGLYSIIFTRILNTMLLRAFCQKPK